MHQSLGWNWEEFPPNDHYPQLYPEELLNQRLDMLFISRTLVSNLGLLTHSLKASFIFYSFYLTKLATIGEFMLLYGMGATDIVCRLDISW